MNVSTLRADLEKSRSRLDWVAGVAEYFSAHTLHFGHGTDSAEDEAFWLVWQLSGTPDRLDDLPPDRRLLERIVGLARRRVEERMPLAYLLGSAWFAGLEFEVGPGVLVPRSPLAEIIERGFEPWARLAPGDRILEVGTGSGCIAIAAAVHLPAIAVDATEIDATALEVARANAARHDVTGRVQFHEADLFPRGSGRYRVIISNPPYVPSSVVADLPDEYRHEPALALDGGRDGLDVVRRILGGAAARLAADGILIVEVGVAAEALMAAYPRVPWTWIEFEHGGEGVFLLTADELYDGWG